jgi:hypothetical protein
MTKKFRIEKSFSRVSNIIRKLRYYVNLYLVIGKCYYQKIKHLYQKYVIRNIQIILIIM